MRNTFINIFFIFFVIDENLLYLCHERNAKRTAHRISMAHSDCIVLMQTKHLTILKG